MATSRGLTPRAVAMAVGVTVAILLVLVLAYLAWRVLTWIIIALFLALALDHAVRFFERRGVPRGIAIGVVFTMVLGALTGLGFLFIPPVVEQVTQLIDDLPELTERLSKGRGPLGFLEREFNLADRVEKLVTGQGEGAAGALTILTGPVLSAVESAFLIAVAILAVIFLTLFMLVSGPPWVEGLRSLVPDHLRPYVHRGMTGMYDAIGGWVVGAAAIALVAGTTATLVLVAMGAPYALPLGVLVGLLDPIPFLGAILASAVVAIVLVASEGWLLAVIFLVFFVCYQQVENHVFYPLVYGQTVELSPLAVLIAVLIGGELAGIVGAIASIPIAGAIKVAAGEVVRYRRERLAATPQAVEELTRRNPLSEAPRT
jgi:predicted PurR-regulated permease PerM